MATRREFLLGSLGALAGVTGPPGLPAGHRQEGTAYLFDPLYLRHDTGAGHPERPSRLLAVEQRLRGEAWFDALHPLSPREADIDAITLVHDPRYVELVRREVEGGLRQLSTGDTAISEESYAVALGMVGGVLEAVDAVMLGRSRNAFCAVRPPGHHATGVRGMGFCLFNGVAVAARYAQQVHGVERVLIADWDVHHGNGTQDIFYTDGSVFFMSTHQYPFYPGTGPRGETGEGAGAGLTMNRPFPAGAGDDEVIGAFTEDLLPAARAFRPDLVLVSAGFDSRIGDLLGGFRVTDDGFRTLTQVMLEIAEIAAGGRLVSVLEGGYTLAGLASAAHAHVEELVHA